MGEWHLKKRKQHSWDWRNALMPLWAYAQIILIAAAAFGLFTLLCLIVAHAGDLGGWFFPVLLAYFGVLVFLLACLLHRRQKHNFLAAVGPEIYFQVYPRDKRRFERREARRRAKLQRIKLRSERKQRRKNCV